MFRKKSEPNSSNFWISYADLMAGLLFVFILLIGAIVSKSIILREDLHKKEAKLANTKKSLEKEKASLDLTKKKLNTLTIKLKQKESALVKVGKNLKNSKDLTQKQKQIIGKSKDKIKKQDKTIIAQMDKIKLQAEEVRKLHMLLDELKNSLKVATDEKSKLSSKLALTQSNLTSQQQQNQSSKKEIDQLHELITLTKDSIKLKEEELERLNQILLARNSKLDALSKKVIVLQNLNSESNITLEQKEKKLQEYNNRVIVLSNQLTKKEDELKLNDKKLASLLDALDKRKSKYENLIEKLKKQKESIRSLTGIRLKVIAELKSTLGDKINIDKKSGALRLSSSILFDKGSSQLKEGAMSELDRSFNDYIGALVSNRAIRPYLQRIVIEGHTDSDGSYLYNIELSQQRALAVMNYLLTLPIAKKYNLKKYLVASGRAYLDSIKRNGREDKEASRRIEIKFQLKNQDAMYQIERILDHDK